MGFSCVFRSASRACKAVKRALKRPGSQSTQTPNVDRSTKAAAKSSPSLRTVVVCSRSIPPLPDAQHHRDASPSSSSFPELQAVNAPQKREKQKRTPSKEIGMFFRLVMLPKKARVASTVPKNYDFPSNHSHVIAKEENAFTPRDRRALVALACSGPDESSALDNAINEILEQNLYNQGVSERASSFCYVVLDG